MVKKYIFEVACGALVIVFVVAALLPVTVRTRTGYTCTLCRAERTDRSIFGISSQTYRDSEFTEWYRTHRPQHQHQWGRLTCTRGSSVFGTTTYFGCGPRHPVCNMPPATLREFAERADTNTLTLYFDGITSTNRDEQRRAVRMAWDKVLEHE